MGVIIGSDEFQLLWQRVVLSVNAVGISVLHVKYCYWQTNKRQALHFNVLCFSTWPVWKTSLKSDI